MTAVGFAKLIEWELTRACDLSCQHCYARPNTPRNHELGTDEALETARRLGQLGCRIVVLSGGEPTVRNDWLRIAAALADEHVLVQLISNGQQVDCRTAALMRDCGVSLVQLSLDGTEEVHDRIRCHAGAFRQVLRAAEALHAAGVAFAFTTTVLRPNLGELETLGELAAEHGAVAWKVWLGIARHGSALWVEPEEVAGLLSRLAALKARGIKVTIGDNLGYQTSCESLRSARIPAGATGAEARFRGCEAGREVLGLQSNGTVTGCLALAAPAAVGNLRETALEELWARARLAHEQRHAALTGGCRRCAQAELCRGGCHATALAATGEIDNPYCALYCRAVARAARSATSRLGSLAAAALLSACGGGGAGGAGKEAEPPPAVSIPQPEEVEEPAGADEAVADADASAAGDESSEASSADQPASEGEIPEGWSVPGCCMAHAVIPDCDCSPIPPGAPHPDK